MHSYYIESPLIAYFANECEYVQNKIMCLAWLCANDRRKHILKFALQPDFSEQPGFLCARKHAVADGKERLLMPRVSSEEHGCS